MEVDIEDIPEDVLKRFYCFVRGCTPLVEIVEVNGADEDAEEEMEAEVEAEVEAGDQA